MREIKYLNTSLHQKCRGRWCICGTLRYVRVLHCFFFFLILELNHLIVALDAAAEKALSSM